MGNMHLAKILRKNMTEAEQKLWYHLRAGRLSGIKFKRQVPIDNYIVDFLADKHNIIIELDGSGHISDKQIIYDGKRDEYLYSKGYTVLRFNNNEIFNNIVDVLKKIHDTII